MELAGTSPLGPGHVIPEPLMTGPWEIAARGALLLEARRILSNQDFDKGSTITATLEASRDKSSSTMPDATTDSDIK